MSSRYTTDPIEVIDVDSHLTEPAGMWVDRAPAKFRDRILRIEEDERGHQSWIADGNRVGAIGMALVAPDGSKISGMPEDFVHRFDDVHAGAYDVKARLGWLDDQGISRQIVFPNLPGFGAVQFFLHIADEELRTTCVTIYNDAVADMQRESGGRLWFYGLIPWWDMDAAVKEVARLSGELDLRGVTMCDNPHEYGAPSLDAPEWEPFWSICEETGLVVAFHIGSGSFRPLAWRQTGGEMHATMTCGAFFSNSWVIANLIFSGVLLKYPGLKIYSAETGIGWLPFLLETMDYQWYENMSADVRRDVWKGTPPSEVFRRNIYSSFWFEQWGVTQIETIGADNVMFETDFPHATSLTGETNEKVAATLATLKPEVRKKVLQDNAIRLYGLS